MDSLGVPPQLPELVETEVAIKASARVGRFDPKWTLVTGGYKQYNSAMRISRVREPSIKYVRSRSSVASTSQRYRALGESIHMQPPTALEATNTKLPAVRLLSVVPVAPRIGVVNGVGGGE